MTMPTTATATTTTTTAPDAPSISGYVTIAEAARLLGKTPGALYMVLYRNPDRYPTVKMGNLHLIPNDTLMALFQYAQEMKKE